MKQCMDSENIHRRLKKIVGQVQAIDRMLDEDIPCEDILSQINAAKSALHKVGQVVLEGHIQHCVRVCRECAELPAFFVAGGTLSGELLRFRKVERKADARGRGYRPGQGLRRGIQLRFREMAKTIAAGPELAAGSNS